MENKTIIIILVAVILVLAAAIGVVLLNPMHAKDPTIVDITSGKSQEEGEKLSIKLTDINKNIIAKEVVNVTITNKKGQLVVDDVVKTDAKGKGQLDLNLKKGTYEVTVTYGGNDKYGGCNATQKLTIKEKEEEVAETSSSSTPSAYAYRSDGSPMYSQAEVDQYMYNKYGLVNYHVGSNGYIDMDEPGYDDAGHRLY